MDSAYEKIETNRRKDAVGKYVNKAILDPQDNIIANRGDLITHEILAKADTFNLADQVLANISENPPQLNKRTEAS